MFVTKKEESDMYRGKQDLLLGCQRVHRDGQYVSIDFDRLTAVAKGLAKEVLPVPDWRIPTVYPHDDDQFIQYLGVMTSINFAFTNFEPPYSKFEVHWKEKTFNGSAALGACFMRALEEKIPVLHARFLQFLSMDDMKHIFRGSAPMPLLKVRLDILHRIGDVLVWGYDGQFARLFEKADFRAFSEDRNGIVNQLLFFFPGYNDVARDPRSGAKLVFAKKAQLCVLIYQGRALHSNGRLKLIKDADDIGPIADYAVPAALKSMGVLTYERAFEQKIRAREVIHPGSQEEIEIRANTILAMERLKDEINVRRAEKINMVHLDYRVWSLGRESLITIPQHLTPTVFY